jgi:Ca2+-binding EF-hand superfamily protein
MPPTAPFENYDGGKTGLIPAVRVSGAFQNENFRVSQSELAQLLKTFRDSRRPELFNYSAFAAAVKKSDIRSSSARASLEDTPILADIDQIAAMATAVINEKLRARNKTIQAAFPGVKSATISSADFEQRIRSLDLIVRPTEMQAILRKYRIRVTDEIDWATFCRDVENSKTVNF